MSKGAPMSLLAPLVPDSIYTCVPPVPVDWQASCRTASLCHGSNSLPLVISDSASEETGASGEAPVQGCLSRDRERIETPDDPLLIHKDEHTVDVHAVG